MAIINCPECNEKISNTIKNCIHCGAAIVICPECETAFVEGVEVCSECGYSFQTTVTTENKTEKTKEEVSEKNETPKITAAQLCEENEKDNFSLQFIKLIKTFISLGPIILCVCGYVKVFNWMKSPNLMLINFKNVYETIIIFIGISLALEFLWKILGFIIKAEKLNSHKRLALTKQTNLHQIIENTLTIDYVIEKPERADSEAVSLVKVLDSELYEKDFNFKNNFTVFLTISIVEDLVNNLLLFFFFKKNIGIWLTAIMLRGDTILKFKDFANITENWWMIIIPSIIALIFYIYNLSSDKFSANRRRFWVKKNFPDKMDTYEKYLGGNYGKNKIRESKINNMTIWGI